VVLAPCPLRDLACTRDAREPMIMPTLLAVTTLLKRPVRIPCFLNGFRPNSFFLFPSPNDGISPNSLVESQKEEKKHVWECQRWDALSEEE